MVENLDQLQWDLLRKQAMGAHGAALSKQPRASSLARAILLLAGLLMMWWVIAQSMGAHWSETSPEFAADLPSASPTALLTVAEARFKALRSLERQVDDGIDEATASKSLSESEPKTKKLNAKGYTEIRSLLESALRKDPLNARAFTLLGQIAASSSVEEETERFMKAAARRSLHEPNAAYWLMRKSYEDGDISTAIRFADIVLRKRPDGIKHVMPVLAQIAEDGSESAQLELVELLATNPPWRSRFFGLLPYNIKDARTPLNILLKLKGSLHPPSSSELHNYLTRLIDKGFYEVAYYTWLQFLSTEQLSKLGLLFNGDFESSPSGLPFDWTFAKNRGVTTKITNRFDLPDGQALLLDFGGVDRVSELSVSQVVTLAPGQYRFEGKYKSDIQSPRGLVWRISCIGEDKVPLGESKPVSKSSRVGWQNFSFSFAVPKEDCQAQRVRLFFNARWASERFISGSIWYDDFRLEREKTMTQ